MDPLSYPQQKVAPLDGGGLFSNIWYRVFVSIAAAIADLRTGYTGTIVTANVTSGGTTGTMTFEDGRLKSQTPAT
jgi:hypothetical protein